ncbi:hypothetical protein TSOC_015210, partial [Tetrabaena socialis]
RCVRGGAALADGPRLSPPGPLPRPTAILALTPLLPGPTCGPPGRLRHPVRLVRRAHPRLRAPVGQAHLHHQRRAPKGGHRHRLHLGLVQDHQRGGGGHAARVAAGAHLADARGIAQGPQGAGQLHPHQVARRRVRVRLLGRLLHHLGPDHLQAPHQPLCKHFFQERRLPPGRVAAGHHGHGPQGDVLGRVRRQRHPHHRRQRRRRGERAGGGPRRRGHCERRRRQAGQAVGLRRGALLLRGRGAQRRHHGAGRDARQAAHRERGHGGRHLHLGLPAPADAGGHL